MGEAGPLSSSYLAAPIPETLSGGRGQPEGPSCGPWDLQGWAEGRPHFRRVCALPRISGNAASDKNIKDGVCAQIEKNFARAKWKVRPEWLSRGLTPGAPAGAYSFRPVLPTHS